MKQFESGRSMVEMLGTLAIIGVLSIGGIAGYSYGMDKYRANETINDIMLKMVDIVSTANQNGVPDSTSWPAENPIGYPVSFLKDIPNDRYGIQLQNVPSRVCKMVGDALKNTAIVYVGGEEQSTNEQDPCDSSDKNTMEFYFDTLKCEPTCKSGKICLWGECVSNQIEITKWPTNISCTQDSDCEPCGWCDKYNGSAFCSPHNGKDCTIKTENDGMCHWGECLLKTGCNDKNPCQGTGEYCASPNTSSLEAFPNNSTGTCMKADYREINVDSKIYHMSSTTMSWWDADAFCRSLGYSGLVAMDDLKDGARTALGNAIYNSTNNPYVWTNETYLFNNEKYAKLINLGSQHISSYPTVGVYHHAVCK